MEINLAPIRNAIQYGDLQGAIVQLLEITQTYVPRFHNEVVLHSARLEEIRADERKGIVTLEEIRREKRRIASALLDLIDHIAHEPGVNQVDREDKMIQILFLAANPSDTDPLRLDIESRAIDHALRQAEFRDQFNIRQHWAVRVTDLQGHLLRYKPDIVHFTGHGSKSSEFVLEDNFGTSRLVSVRALSQLFSVLKDNIRCVVLNACYSEPQALAIAEHIDCVIGMSRAIGDGSHQLCGCILSSSGIWKGCQNRI